jgi:hypothetical protein
VTGRARKIVFAGSLAQRPGNGGHTWVLLQYLLGLRRLGFDVLFLDRIEPEMCTDRAGKPVAFESSFNRAYFDDVMRGFEVPHALLHAGEFLGRDRPEVARFVAESELLINVMGFFNDADLLGRARRRVFLDIDPGFPQMWRVLGLADMFAGHDAFVTIGANVGGADCEVPTCGLEWITTPQPIVLDHWPVTRQGNGKFTSVASWRGPFGPIEFNGKTYGLRVHEFRKFIELPKICNLKSKIPDCRFEVAMDIDAAETKDLALLAENGWQLADPKTVACDPATYRRYVQGSAAELMIAKNLYVATRGGWFSDRSICYLASGKPVLAQDTHLAHLYPTGEGLVTFGTLEEATAGVESITRNYVRHAAAARRIAEENFDSDKVLANLLTKLGVAA